jgi:DNA polymerase-3 subunit beta
MSALHTGIQVMQNSFEREALVRALTILDRTAPKRAVIPILLQVQIDASAPGVVTFRTTDLDRQTTILFAPESGVAGAPFCAPCHDLLAWVKARPSGALISLSRDGSAAPLVATCAGARAQFATSPADDFPAPFKDAIVTARIEMPAPRLAAILDRTRLAISTEETRYYLNGIYISRDFMAPHDLFFVATDGHRLSETRIAMETEDFPGVIAPTLFIAALAPLLKGVKGPVTLELSSKIIRARVGDVTLDSNVVDGTFPDWQRVIPGDNNRVATFDGGLLAKILAPLAKGREPAKLIFAGDRLTVTQREAGSEMETTESMAVNWRDDKGKALEIGFNPRYLLDMLKSLPGGLTGPVTGLFAKAGSPALFTAANQEETRHVVMPLRV